MSPYRGRFAPSPTGPLHFGSLIAAVGSYLDARSRSGSWLVRMEDLDQPRAAPGAADAILSALEAYGFEWDGEIIHQSRRDGAYADALVRLDRMKAVFPCACTRKEIADSALSLQGEPVYPGTCRNGLPPGRAGRAVRVRVDDAVIGFDDRLQGRVEQNLAAEIGDFMVRRADGLFAYQLAVVVDDAEQGITDVVRGADLLASTPRQILLQRLLGYPIPRYLHLPVAVNARGEKLSKQTLATALDPGAAVPTLLQTLSFLNQQPPAALALGTLREVWRWAIAHWDSGKAPRETALPVPNGV
ncbi:MAG: tRNA glutamyl-Q(34) synthetase GluQRS [Burkholderiales bacterium]